MLTRIPDFFDFFSLAQTERDRGLEAARLSGEASQGMTHLRDYEALAAAVLDRRPHRIFEIGTYLGGTSDFFLSLLPESHVVSIAYLNPTWRLLGKSSNNSELRRNQVGSRVAAERRSRFTQLYGDSHKLKGSSLIQRFGHFDFVFIDGDHSRDGVAKDTDLANNIISEGGVVAWHDANPKRHYEDVKRFLEDELTLHAVATKDDYLGGVAFWSKTIEQRLNGQANARATAANRG